MFPNWTQIHVITSKNVSARSRTQCVKQLCGFVGDYTFSFFSTPYCGHQSNFHQKVSLVHECQQDTEPCVKLK